MLCPTISIIPEGIIKVKLKSEDFLRFVGLHKTGGIALDNLSFIARYEAILKAKKIPKGVFYQDCGITDAAVSQWRKGKTAPSMKSIDRIAEYLSVTAEYLLTGLGEKEKAPTSEGGRSKDHDIYRIERAKKRMPKDEWEKQMRIIEASFGDYFSDDYDDDDVDE